MDLCPGAHHRQKINRSHGAIAELVVVLAADAEEVTTMNITEHPVEAALQIQAGAAEPSHLRRRLHKFQLLALHRQTSPRVLLSLVPSLV